MLTACSATVVVWCFWSTGPQSTFLAHRDERGGTAIALCLVILALNIFIFAIAQLLSPPESDDISNIVALDLVSFIVFAILATAKCYVGLSLKSHTLQRDAACSLSAALAALASATGAAGSDASNSHDSAKASKGW